MLRVTSARYWNNHRLTDYKAFGVCRHVVIAFKGMRIIWFALSDKYVENTLHIAAHIRVGVLIKRKRGTCMFYKKV